ncbi:MAG: FkbM family methyltransferase [Marinilabiliales bacterium]|nr:MAG: FkbM family methyltransferase [Marinilabiliales bacterium]
MIKTLIREVLTKLKIDLTKNLKYDRLTIDIMKLVLNKNSNCIDVGCHKGEMLDLMLKYAPDGRHYAFEPIPFLYNNLKNKFSEKAEIYPYALSDKKGQTTFNYVKNAPAYSGIKKRHYDIKNPDIEKINVELHKLDDLIAQDTKIDLIKIDVEGAELGVLKGATKTISKNKPCVIFEFGLGASDYYGTTPEDIYKVLVDDCGLNIYKLHDWIKGKEPMSLEGLSKAYNQEGEYYFIAYK